MAAELPPREIEPTAHNGPPPEPPPFHTHIASPGPPPLYVDPPEPRPVDAAPPEPLPADAAPPEPLPADVEPPKPQSVSSAPPKPPLYVDPPEPRPVDVAAPEPPTADAAAPEPRPVDVEPPKPPPLDAAAPEPPPVYVDPLPPGPLPRLLAGLESGILGAALMICWFAVDSLMERQYWWAILNLWGASVYHNRVFSMGFGLATLAGASAHFFLHGVGGALWSLAAARMSNYWAHLACSFLAAAGWYYFLMHLFWPAVAPVVSRLTPLPATILAYFLFGAALSRNAHRARQLRSVCET